MEDAPVTSATAQGVTGDSPERGRQQDVSIAIQMLENCAESKRNMETSKTREGAE